MFIEEKRALMKGIKDINNFQKKNVWLKVLSVIKNWQPYRKSYVSKDKIRCIVNKKTSILFINDLHVLLKMIKPEYRRKHLLPTK